MPPLTGNSVTWLPEVQKPRTVVLGQDPARRSHVTRRPAPAKRTPALAGSEVLPNGGQLRRAAYVVDLVRVAVLGAYVAALVVVLARYGIPFEREQILAWTLGFVIAFSVALGANWRRATGAVRDWAVFAVLLVIYDYSRGVADWWGGCFWRPTRWRWVSHS